MTQSTAMPGPGHDGSPTSESLTVRDNRTGQDYDAADHRRHHPAADLGADQDRRRRARASRSTTPASPTPPRAAARSPTSTATRASWSTAATRSSSWPRSPRYLEVAYLLIHGELPTKEQYDAWVHEITYHTFVHENVKSFMQGFRYDAHPMGMLLASVGALSTFYPESRNISDADNRHMQIVRLIAKMPTLGAWSFRHAQGKPYVYPDNDLGYAANFLSMLFKMSEQKFEADERLVKALEVLFILHADHEQNCSTNAVRSVGSSQVDPYSAVAAGIAALYGPLHGGANEAVLRMLRRIGSVDNVPDFIEGVKNGNERLMGFGHRVYKNYDPRAKIIKKACDDVFEVTGVNPLLKIAVELEKIALEDEYFVKRKLYPNVDFYSRPDLRGAAVPAGDVHRAVRHPAHARAGWRSGSSWSRTRTRRSPAPSRSTPASARSTSSRSLRSAGPDPSHGLARVRPRRRRATVDATAGCLAPGPAAPAGRACRAGERVAPVSPTGTPRARPEGFVFLAVDLGPADVVRPGADRDGLPPGAAAAATAPRRSSTSRSSALLRELRDRSADVGAGQPDGDCVDVLAATLHADRRVRDIGSTSLQPTGSRELFQQRALERFDCRRRRVFEPTAGCASSGDERVANAGPGGPSPRSARVAPAVARQPPHPWPPGSSDAAAATPQRGRRPDAVRLSADADHRPRRPPAAARPAR